MHKSESLTVRVNPMTKTRLDALSRATKRSKSYVVEEALELYRGGPTFPPIPRFHVEERDSSHLRLSC